MKKTIFNLLWLLSLPCLGVINYDAGLGFKVIGSNCFSGYRLQYNFSQYHEGGWTDVDIGNNETVTGDILYFSSGIILNADDKDVYWRILNEGDLRVSDIHKTAIKRRCVNFLQLSILDEQSEDELVTDSQSYDNSLPYYAISFKTNDFSNYNGTLVRLLSPERNYTMPVYGTVNFSWQLTTDLPTTDLTSYLVFRDSGNNVVETINISGQSSYNLQGMTYFINSNGVYTWQIVVVNINGQKYASELRPIGIATLNTDSDNDGYYDFYEKYRRSDPYNADDIPGLFDQSNNFPNAVKGCQYSYQFSTKQRQNLLAWSLKGALPSGLVLKNTGTISGIPQQSGNFEFIVEVIDSKGKWDEFPVFLTVEEPQSSEISIK